MLNEDIVFSLMKEIARKNNGEAPGDMLLTLLSRNKIRYNSKTVKKVLVSLYKQRKISMANGHFCWIVNAPMEELEAEHNASKESIVTIDKVKFIIREFYAQNSEYPKPNDIENMFWKKFGRPNLKDFTRFLRDMVEEGSLLRTDDFRYYFKYIDVQENVSINTFLKEKISL